MALRSEASWSSQLFGAAPPAPFLRPVLKGSIVTVIIATMVITSNKHTTNNTNTTTTTTNNNDTY